MVAVRKCSVCKNRNRQKDTSTAGRLIPCPPSILKFQLDREILDQVHNACHRKAVVEMIHLFEHWNINFVLSLLPQSLHHLIEYFSNNNYRENNLTVDKSKYKFQAVYNILNLLNVSDAHSILIKLYLAVVLLALRMPAHCLDSFSVAVGNVVCQKTAINYLKSAGAIVQENCSNSILNCYKVISIDNKNIQLANPVIKDQDTKRGKEAYLTNIVINLCLKRITLRCLLNLIGPII